MAWTKATARDFFNVTVVNKPATAETLREIHDKLPIGWRVLRDGFTDAFVLYVPDVGLVDILSQTLQEIRR